MSSYLKREPQFGESVFVADGALIVGDVEIGEGSSIWFNAVVRGDVNSIRIGKFTNIQDGCLLHVTHERFSLTIGDHVTVGHGAILHGCTVQNMCLIGMGAILLDGASVGEGGIVAAGSLVREGRVIPPGKLVAGVPAKVIRDVTPEELREVELASERYRSYVKSYLSLGKKHGKSY